MADYRRRLIKILEAHGCTVDKQRGKGSHELWSSPISGKSFTVQRDLYRIAANEVLKQAGIPERL